MADPPRPSPRTSVRTVAVWAALRGELDAHADPGPAGGSLAVLDAGGGTGGFAVPLAELGHRVTVVDPSPDSLAALERRAAEAGVTDRVAAVQGDLATLLEVVPPDSHDLALCHSVLEVVDDPAVALTAVAGSLRPGGAASVLAANRVAVVFARALAGHLTDAVRALDDPAGRWGDGDVVVRRFTLDELVALLAGAGLEVESVHGVRVFADLIPGGLLDADPAAGSTLTTLELAASARPAFRDVATKLHLLARRR